MRVIVTGDWHIGITQYGVIGDDGRNSRLADVESTLLRIIALGEEHGADMFVCTGDVFHQNKPSQEAQLVFWKILSRLRDSKYKWARFIIGNHDYQSKLGESHALKIFQAIIDSWSSFDTSCDIKIYDQTTWEAFGDNSLLVCFYPYRGSWPVWADMARFGAVGATALVCHSHLEGAVVGAEPFEIQGDAATRFTQLPVGHVWAGHFHKPQLLCDTPLAFYPGSVQAVDFAERNDVKGAVLVCADTRTYKTIGVKTRELRQLDVEGRSSLLEEELAGVLGAIVKVNVSLSEEDAHQFDEAVIRQQLINAGVHSIASINLKVERKQVVRDKNVNLDVKLEDSFNSYIVTRVVKRIEEIRSKGLDIIKECVQ